MVKKSRREFIKNAGLGCLSLSVTPYLIGINNEASSETVGNFNKHSFLNPVVLHAGSEPPQKHEEAMFISAKFYICF